MQISVPRPAGLSCVAASVIRCDAAIGFLSPPIGHYCMPGSKMATTCSQIHVGIIDKKPSTVPLDRGMAQHDAAYAACNRELRS